MAEYNKVHAPYNFVPLCDKVFFPGWADQISHDVPFSDGLTGVLRLQITAETPIFVRNGAAIGKDVQKEDTFSHDKDGRYFIPGTSIKGAIRSVLEILSCGKMRLDEKAAYAQREWNSPEIYPIKSPTAQGKIHGGYLKLKTVDGEPTYVITDHDIPLRISQPCIDDILGGERKLTKNFGTRASDPFLNDDQKTAAYKYGLVDDKKLSEVRSFKEVKNAANKWKKIVEPDKGGNIKGRIVLTGQPDTWRKGADDKKDVQADKGGKYYEFVFKEKEVGEHTITKEKFDNYKFIYDKKETKKDWERIKSLIEDENGPGAPIFFRLEEYGDKVEVKDFGFALLYRLPYARTPFESLDAELQDTETSNFDLADCLFGRIGKDVDRDGGKALRGRVRFSHAFAIGVPKTEAGGAYLLSSPKASYYPTYIEQESKRNKGGYIGGAYKTYNDSNIRGWKRYVLKDKVRNPDKTWQEYEQYRNSSVAFKEQCSPVRPLAKGSRFTCDVHFFNLLPEELGALISAISFHGNEGKCFHQFGGAKPYGFGRSKVEFTEGSYVLDITESEQIVEKDIDHDMLKGYMASFQQLMERHTENDWLKSDRLTQLFTLSTNVETTLNKGEEGDASHNFEYMTLSVKSDKEKQNDKFAKGPKTGTQDRNDFVDAKGGKDGFGSRYYLRRFTEITSGEAFKATAIDADGPSEADSAKAKQLISEATQAKTNGNAEEAKAKFIAAQAFCQRKGLPADECTAAIEELNRAKAEQKLEEARTLKQEGKYDEATALLAEVEYLSPTLSDSCEEERQEINLAQAAKKLEEANTLIGEGQFSEARKLLDEAKQLDPTLSDKCKEKRQKINRAEAEQKLVQARQLKGEGKFDDARRLFEGIRDTRPSLADTCTAELSELNRAEALHNIAKAGTLIGAGNFNEARDLVERAKKLSLALSDDTLANSCDAKANAIKSAEAKQKVAEARTLIGAGKFDGVKNLLAEAERLDPTLSAECKQLMANLEGDKGKRMLDEVRKLIKARDRDGAQNLIGQVEKECPSLYRECSVLRGDILMMKAAKSGKGGKKKK